MMQAAFSHVRPKACCFRAALDRSATFCDECGQPILRCMASEECGGLLDEDGRCPVCVAPELSIDAGAVSSVKVGGALSIPLLITNTSAVGRPLFIKEMWVKAPDKALTPVDLAFQRLASGAVPEVSVSTGALPTAGVHRIEVIFIAATRYLWREECYAFSASFAVDVEAESAGSIVQNINVSADQIGAGMTIYNPTRMQREKADAPARRAEPIVLTLQRADSFERQEGYRGYESGIAVPRSVALAWAGFDHGQVPPDGPIRTQTGVLSFGRASNAAHSGMNDVRLVISGPDGTDEDASVHISRRHFLLYVENDRLMLRVESQNGLSVNGDPLRRGETAILKDGDVIAPLVRRPDAISLQVSFDVPADEVGQVVLRRRIGTGRR